MRPVALLLALLTVILTACGGSPTPVLPTAAALPNGSPTDAVTSGEPTPDPNAQAAQGEPMVDSSGQLLAITLPAPGTIIPALTEDPEIGLIFDVLTYTRTGGITGQTVSVELRQDGTFIRDGVTSNIGTAEVQRIDSMIDAVNFFGLQGLFVSMRGTSADTYRYTLTVERNGASAMVTAEDGLTPPELLNLFAELNVLGTPTQ